MEESLATFIKRVPRLFEAMKNGQQPEATKLWQKGCEDMVLLLFYRWWHARHLLLVEPYALVPMAPRSYELGTFRGNVEQEEESDDAYRSSIAEHHDAQRGAALRGAELGEFILKMRIPEFPFPISSPRADSEEDATGDPVFAIHESVVKKALESAGHSGPDNFQCSRWPDSKSGVRAAESGIEVTPSRGGWGCTVAPCRSLLAAQVASTAQHADNLGAAHGKLPPGTPSQACSASASRKSGLQAGAQELSDSHHGPSLGRDEQFSHYCGRG